jgi:hypothetical protein
MTRLMKKHSRFEVSSRLSQLIVCGRPRATQGCDHNEDYPDGHQNCGLVSSQNLYANNQERLAVQYDPPRPFLLPLNCQHFIVNLQVKNTIESASSVAMEVPHDDFDDD